MNLLLSFAKFVIYSIFIVLIAKNLLVKCIRRLAEALELDADIIGDVAGIATSMPEIISVFFVALEGMFTAGIFNIISSNVINLIQYIIAIYKNKNQIYLQNEALRSDMIMVIFTIALPLFIIVFNIGLDIGVVPIFIMLFILFYIINRNTHKLYLPNINKQEKSSNSISSKGKVAFLNTVYLIFIGIALFIVGELLGTTVREMSYIFNISEIFIGIMLGFITSIPELITFIESQKNSKNEDNDLEGVIEATNNLLTSNNINLFVVLTIGIIVTACI